MVLPLLDYWSCRCLLCSVATLSPTKIEQEKFDPLFFYCFLGILLGARLGHCLLYEPHYFLQHPLEIFLPMRQDGLGHWHFTGFAGLASHGGTAGLMAALWLYVRKTKVPLLRVLDNIAIATPHHGLLHTPWQPHEL